MKVLVTGAEGQVGSEMVRLSGDGFEVSGFDRRALDITEVGDVERRMDECTPDLLVNCAAYTAVDRAEDDPDTAYRVNADAVGLLGRSCAKRGIGIVHLSTDYVFDGTKDGSYSEEDVPNPLSVYGASKLAGEELLRDTTDRCLILRASWVFGRVGGSFVDTILRLAAERDEISVVDDQVGSPTPAAAIAGTIKRIGCAVAKRDAAWGTYHFSAAPPLSWFDFARRIVALGVETGVLRATPDVGLTPIPSSAWPAKARRPLNSRLDMHKLTGAFSIYRPAWAPYLRQSVAAHGMASTSEDPTRAATP